jgi:hypothetical protein
MTSVTEDDISRLEIKMQRLLALVEECADLGLRQVEYMATGVATKTLEGRCGGFEMMPNTPQHG